MMLRLDTAAGWCIRFSSCVLTMFFAVVLLFMPCCSTQTEFNSQKQIMEAQRDLLEQQQAVLRKLAAHKQAQLAGGQAKGDKGDAA